jgi:hypothetical protein
MNEMSQPPRRPMLSRCLELPTPAGPMIIVLPVPPLDEPLEAVYLSDAKPDRTMIHSAPASPDVALGAARALIEAAMEADPGIVRRAGDPDVAAILGMLGAAKRQRRWPG